MKKLVCAALVAVLMLGGASCGTSGGDEADNKASASADDSNPALNAPDETAWRLFVQVMTPATQATPATKGGSAPPTPATFELWASDAETFRPNATWPGDGPGIAPRTARPTLALAQAGHGAAGAAPAPGIQPNTLHNAAMEDVHRNRATFDYIVNNRLNSISGLQAAYRNALDVTFPVDSIEVKTNWLPLDQLARYYPAEVAAHPELYFYIGRDSTDRGYALLSMHIISKQVPNWTWATFEHQATPGRCDIIGCHDAFGAQVADVPPAATPEGNYGQCAKSPALQAMFTAAGLGAVYNNYCLKGSQTDFTDATGLAVRLGNSITEGGFVETSSCMTCHATAGFTANGQSTDDNAPIGPVPTSIYWTGGGTPPYQNGPGLTRVALPADFVWAIPTCAYDDVSQGYQPPNQPKPSPCAPAPATAVRDGAVSGAPGRR